MTDNQMPLRVFFIGILLVPLMGCGHHTGLNPDNYIQKNSHISEFSYCYGYGCRQQIIMGLHPKD